MGDVPLYDNPNVEAERRRQFGLPRRAYVGTVTDNGHSETLTVRSGATEVSLTRDWRGRSVEVTGRGFTASRNAHKAVLEALSAPVAPTDSAGIEAFHQAVAQAVLPASIQAAIDHAVREALEAPQTGIVPFPERAAR